MALASAGANADTTLTIKPGGLEKELSGIKLSGKVTLKGECDARDLSLMRSLGEGVTILDMSALKVNGYSDSTPRYFHRIKFDDNEIPEYCFFSVASGEVLLPSATDEIGDGAFAGSDINDMTLPEAVRKIGNYAFYDCGKLATVTLPASVESLGEGVFGKCTALKKADLSATAIKEIPNQCFAGCTALEEVILPKGLVRIGREAFRGTAIHKLTIETVSQLAPYSLSDMPALKEVNMGDAVSAGEGALMGNTSLLRINGHPGALPAYFAANSTNLNSMQLLEEADNVGKYALASTANENIILSPNLRRIETGAFKGMTTLKNIDVTRLAGNIPETADDAFDGITPSDVSLQVEKGTEEIWKSHPVWSRFNIEGFTSASSITGTDFDGIAITIDGEMLRVRAADNLTAVEIYDANGNLLLHLTPGVTDAAISTAVLPQGIAIVRGATAKKIKTVKIML